MPQARLEDSNIALLSSDLALEVRKASAEAEPAFDGAGEKEGVEIWRVEKLKIVRWPREQYGSFFDGDAYIVLHSYKKKGGDKMLYNVHFWIGVGASQDEAAVAAYKTVELDDRLGQLPVQFRQVQDHETDEFLDLFQPSMMVMSGGVESGFTKVEPTAYKPRLLHVKGQRKAMRVRQVPLTRDSINDGDVYVLDAGLSLYQWNGTAAGVFEKRKGNEVATAIRADRQGRPRFQVLDGQESCPEFWDLLGGMGPVKAADEGGADSEVLTSPKRMLRLSDASGTLTMTVVSSGKISKSDLDTADTFLVDNGGVSLFVWIGNGASRDERAKAFQYANQYIVDNNLPLTIPVSRVTEGNTSAAFEKAFEE
ncbi:unnamed protein product [Vitrella brassicaformis CCMP3155]|uniref:Gelsolin-like domain-containing protein n=1 Tax=Vitrella brassicaformis (strain CCMP3155) TaxID=1169540 RepID=A0A0G4FXE0_VITBC|nr:unnamed protein product [Vitrella brassicaformis CCMP3155]|mmetsp:Transcript_51991/g.130612  ORF Transcript_51991/g.130612 Transcript_51991/m.130612 type:complete len:367 (-) Transcript_51991:3903-5003(-)|eukprot:CEM20072.1 unnamed protein product [Vitrella brassicaformis CCMP3155]